MVNVAVTAVLAGLLAGSARAEAPASLLERRWQAAMGALEARRGTPEAVAPLAALVALLPDLGAARVVPVLTALAQDRSTDPLVAAQAEYQLALAAAARGDDAAASATLDRLGLFDRFAIVGPFDAAGRGGLAQVHPPEEPGNGPPAAAATDAAAARAFPGKERDVSWRVTGVRAAGALALDGLLRPDKDATAYVVAYIRNPRARPAAIRFGSPGPTKIWVGGRLVHTADVVREARFDQDAAPITLAAGETAIMVKTVITNGAWRLFLRLTDPAGRPLTGVTVAAQGRAPVVLPGTARRAAAAPARELGTLLRARAEAARTPAAWLDYGRWLGLSRQADREGKAEEEALEAAAATEAGAAPDETATDALLALGARASEDDDRRRAYERALATSDPGRKAIALVGLAELARARRRDSDAVARLRAAAAADPGNLDALIGLAAEEESVGLPAHGLGRLEAALAGPRAVPAARTSFRVRLARARLNETLGRKRAAEAERAEIWQTRRTDLELALGLARAARDRGDVVAAIAYHAQAAPHRPDLTFVVTEWARMLEGQGDVAGARAKLESLAARLPDEASVFEELGRLEVRAGGLAAGAPHLRRALALRPQNPALRRYLARLEAELRGESAEAGDDLVRAFSEDGETLARPALAGKLAPRPGGGTDVLLDKRVVRVHRNGLSERLVQRVVLLRTEQAVREAVEQGIRYTPGSQEVEVRRARIYRRGDGPAAGTFDIDVIEAAGRDDRDLSEPWYGLYYDVRAEVVLFEGLRPGDVVELTYTIADVSLENVLRDYFGDLELIGEAAPRRRWEYTLLAPADRKFYFNQPTVAAPAKLERSEERRGDEILTRFVATDVGAVLGEPGMPGWTEVIPYLHVSTFAGWPDVGRWYWGLISDQLKADETLRRAGREALAGADTPLAKVRALHRLVLESTRYVGLEFGIHGYKPYKVTQVFARRFGDCKDKASLLHVLLREAGIESEIVLLRTRRAGKLAPFPASLSVFDHAIVYVPALELYLDGTAEFSGLKELPSEDQGVLVLRVGPRGSSLTETPVLPAADNRVARRWRAKLDAEGGARIEEEISVSGQAAPDWREHYETPGERQERFARVWDERFPGSVLERVEFEGELDRNRPVVARSVAAVPALGEPGPGGQWLLPLSAREPDLVKSYARLSARRQEYVLAYPFQHEETLRYELPAGYEVAVLPAPASRRISSRFGKFELAVSASPAASTDGPRFVEVITRTEVAQHRIPPADYPEFRRFLAEVDAALHQPVVLQKAAQSPRAAR